MNNNEQQDLIIPNVSFRPIPQKEVVAKLDLTLNANLSQSGGSFSWEYDTSLFTREHIEQLNNHLVSFLKNITETPSGKLNDLSMLSAKERHYLRVSLNDTKVDYQQEELIQTRFEQQVKSSQSDIALVFDDQEVSYSTLNEKANQLAHYLMANGVSTGDLVGLCVERSVDMMVALLAILKAGAAYVPLDPSYPAKRLKIIIDDSKCRLVITQQEILSFLDNAIGDTYVCLDDLKVKSSIEKCSRKNVYLPKLTSKELAYVIYTSGSTGKPKGVMVEHRNVINFFTALDQKFNTNDRKTWLALTSINFDISVLELFWTMCSGHKVVLARDRILGQSKNNSMAFSLFYFAAEEANTKSNKYRLLLEGAKLAEKYGFKGVWVPERHFHSFGDQFPNPSVAAAAVAATTKNIKIRSGSVVLPLHDPIRVAEEWSMVDNLSDGRVEMAIASGWHPNDFVFAPGDFKDRHRIMKEKLDVLQDLWNGKSCTRLNGIDQEVEISVHPKPVQKSLTTWITAAGSPHTFEYAGSIGANVLTHLLGQSISELKEKIELYRNSLIKHGFDASSGKVALMIHTFIGSDLASVESKVEKPFKNYLRHSIGLIKPFAEEMGLDINENLESVVDIAYQRYFSESGLFGTPDSVVKKIEDLNDIGVDECACLIDFGINHQDVLDNLSLLNELKEKINRNNKQQSYLNRKFKQSLQVESLEQTLLNQKVTHIQCTPSYAQEISSILLDDKANQHLESLFVGGEPLPTNLAEDLTKSKKFNVFNMYGPTETTVWSSFAQISDKNVYVSGPIANTQFYVVNNNELAPFGVPGELYIGGDSVARGYLNREDLTQEKFISNHFDAENQNLMYKTGDVVRYIDKGKLEFLGRVDDQVKIRGFRIELGDIESHIAQDKDVDQCLVVAKSDGAEIKRLIAYVVVKQQFLSSNKIEFEKLFVGRIKQHLREELPDYMVPSAIVIMDKFPLTLNGKIDKKALPLPDVNLLVDEYTPADTSLEETLVDIWVELLKLTKDEISVTASFFDLGGHSLLLIRLISAIEEVTSVKFDIRQLYDNSTIREIAELIDYYKLSHDLDGRIKNSTNKKIEQVEF